MNISKADLFIMINNRFFDSFQLKQIRERLSSSDDSTWVKVQTMQFKDPTLSLMVSILAGHFGIDRFMIGDTGLGIGKLLTCGGLGIWSIVDWFLIMDATKEKNFTKLHQALAYNAVSPQGVTDSIPPQTPSSNEPQK